MNKFIYALLIIVMSKVSFAQEVSPQALISQMACTACHSQSARVVGPSFNQISRKYPSTRSNVTMLANKIISGGAGTWCPIPMPAQLGLPFEQAELIAAHILNYQLPKQISNINKQKTKTLNNSTSNTSSKKHKIQVDDSLYRAEKKCIELGLKEKQKRLEIAFSQSPEINEKKIKPATLI